MAGRDTDIRRFGEVTGNNLEFRQFGAQAVASGDWSLLNAVSRSAEPGSFFDAPKVQTAFAHDQDSGWSKLANLKAASPLQSAEAVTPQPKLAPVSVPQIAPPKAANSAPRPVDGAQPGFAHLFRKTVETDTSLATSPLAELLKAISRCP